MNTPAGILAIELSDTFSYGCDELHGDEGPPCYEMCRDGDDGPTDSD